MDEQEGTVLLHLPRRRPRGVQRMVDVPRFKANAFTGCNSPATSGDWEIQLLYLRLLCIRLFGVMEQKSCLELNRTQIGVLQPRDILACMEGKGNGKRLNTMVRGEKKKKIYSVAFSLNLLSPDQGNIRACQHVLSHLTRETSVLSMWQWQAKHRCLTISALSIHHFIHLNFSLLFYLAHVLQLPLCKGFIVYQVSAQKTLVEMKKITFPYRNHKPLLVIPMEENSLWQATAWTLWAS